MDIIIGIIAAVLIAFIFYFIFHIHERKIDELDLMISDLERRMDWLEKDKEHEYAEEMEIYGGDTLA